MLVLTAGYIGENPDQYIGKPVQFGDYHGRAVTGILESAEAPTLAAYAVLRVNGTTKAVWRNTTVTVGA